MKNALGSQITGSADLSFVCIGGTASTCKILMPGPLYASQRRTSFCKDAVLAANKSENSPIGLYFAKMQL